MNRRHATLVLASTIGAAAAGFFGWRYFHSQEEIIFETAEDERFRKAKAGTNEEKQKYLDEMFHEVSPENLERIVFDPKKEQAAKDIFGMYREALYSTTLCKMSADAMLRQQVEAMYVPAVMELTGNGKKRKAYALSSLFGYAKHSADVRSIIVHEDKHGDQERKGYQSFAGRITARELLELRKAGTYREAVWIELGELEANASQLGNVFNQKDRVSQYVFEASINTLDRISRLIGGAMKQGKLHPLEAAYASVVFGKYDATLQRARDGK